MHQDLHSGEGLFFTLFLSSTRIILDQEITHPALSMSIPLVMKTQLILRKNLLGSLFFLIAFLFAFVSKGQSNNFYYYRGEKIGLELDKKSLNISVFQNFQRDNLKKFNLKAYSLENDLSQKEISTLRYARIEFAETLTDLEYFERLHEIKKIGGVRTVSPSFLTGDDIEIGLSDYLYVKLKRSKDYRYLAEKALEYNIEIVEQDEYMPLWYTLRCSENTPFSSLEIANALFETGLFTSSAPDLMTKDDMSCTNDPDFNQLWGLSNTLHPNADINACAAWSITEGNGVNVAVLDGGIELTHIDLAANISPLSYDTESDSSPSLVFDSHGTHVAGILGAVKDNNTQVVGIAPECTLFSISNSFEMTPNSRQKRADGINWAVLNGVDVISNSWGSPVQYQQIDDAIDNALTNGRNGLGCIVVFAAGNAFGSSVDYPARYHPDILAVGSTEIDGERSDFSNFDDKLDVMAPGRNILSTIPNNGTELNSGTSMATPLVSGVAALVLSVNPCLTAVQVNDIIEQTCQKTGSFSYSTIAGRPNGDYNYLMGYGLIDAYAAVLLAQSTSCIPLCNASISTFPYNESFENNFGDWEQSSDDDFDWTRNSGSTNSNETGPSSASEGSFYVYVESSYPNYPSKTTIISSPCFDLTHQFGASLSFDYHMYGSSMGTLDLEVSADGGHTWTHEWSLNGNQGDSWSTTTLNLNHYSGNLVQLRFIGTTANSYRSDMAIDNISISTNACKALVNSFPYTESFETDFGLWSQDVSDDFDWTRNSGSTPSTGTGPLAAADGSHYAFIESSYPNNPYKSAILNSACFDFTNQWFIDLHFSYNLYGQSSGSLALEITQNDGASWNTLWTGYGEQTKKWLPINVSLSAYKGSIVQLRFVGTSGNGYQGDAAIDGIQIVTAKKIKGKNYFQSELNSSLMDSPQIMIFPNPAQDYAVLEIESLEAEEVTVSVVDNLGKEIFTHPAHLGESKTEFRLPTSTFAPGSYIVIVTSNSGQIFNEKLIVSK